MMNTKSEVGKLDGRQCYHIIQSFKPGEVTPELALEIAKEFAAQLTSMMDTIIPCYVKEGKYHLNIAFGCTGGQHRSVTMANHMAEVFREKGYRVTLKHRDL